MTSPARSAFMTAIALGALLVSALVAGYFIGLHGPVPDALLPGKVAATEPGPGEPSTIAPREDFSPSERSVIDLYERCSPSVVYISPLREVRQSPFSRATQVVPVGTGSGFVWDKAGHIVTNYHVVQGASGAIVTLSDRTEYRATKLAPFPDKDLAVLTIEAPPEKLAPLAVGTSADLKVGQTVFAIGNPYGLDTTLTHGLISALGREIASPVPDPRAEPRIIHDVIQTDAAINPGNSGGPLLDSAGRLIGVNTQISSPTGSSIGLGFAIPVDDVRRIVDQLITTGKVSRPALGVTIATASDMKLLARYGLRLAGVPLTSVTTGSAADDAGLRGADIYRVPDGTWLVGDIILKVDDQATPDPNSLRDALESHEVGDTVTLTIQRGQERLEVPVKLQALEQ